MKIVEYFTEVETVKEHKGYFCSIGEALTIVILGSMCGLRNVSQIHQWASSQRVKVFLREYFEIRNIPFGEDFCRVEDRNIQQTLNIVRKIVLNTVRYYKEKTASKRPVSKVIFDCLLDCKNMLPIFACL